MTVLEALTEWRKRDDYKHQDGIHWFVWLVENPSSPFSLRGATRLYQHDIIHLILDRKMELLDECYVIGFTMGNCAKKHHDWRYHVFLWIAENLYPEGYRFVGYAEHEFVRGWDQGFKKLRRNIHKHNFNKLDTIENLRSLYAVG